MAKVLLAEDDNNLREIFEMRLQAEGYETVTAGDGEEALVVAMKEKPDLIIADVMMPRLSGFEMLESLRAAPGMASTKVVMMTALGQAEDQARGEKLGVVKYLVKSQVTLEDFARVIGEVLPPDGGGAKTTNQESEHKMQDDTNPAPAPAPGAADDTSAPATDGQMSSDDATKAMNDQVGQAMGDAGGAPATDAPAPAPAPDMPAPGGDDTAAPAEAPAEGGAAPAEGSADTTGSL